LFPRKASDIIIPMLTKGELKKIRLFTKLDKCIAMYEDQKKELAAQG
jgi:hypothetical protein